MNKYEIVLPSLTDGRPIGLDVRYIASNVCKPVVLFVHGFKGFKDAMHFNLIADTFAHRGFVFIKMNFSHNGVTLDYPLDFVDLEAFGSNNFSTELDDIKCVIDYLIGTGLNIPANEIDVANLSLIGHSRGGSVCLLKAGEDRRVRKIVTWAAVPDLTNFFSKAALAAWKDAGVRYVKNGRTQQDMPMYYQMVEDFQRQGDRFLIHKTLANLDIPFLAVHGTADETVPVAALSVFKLYYSKTKTHQIVGATHTFGGRHPWEGSHLPLHTEELIAISDEFLKS